MHSKRLLRSPKKHGPSHTGCNRMRSAPAHAAPSPSRTLVALSSSSAADTVTTDVPETSTLASPMSDASSVSSSSGGSSGTTKQLKLRISSCCLPHPAKEHYGGEDAHFVSDVGGGALGVADGVGGWADSGINPAEYSRRFMEVAQAYLEGRDGYGSASSSKPVIDPRGALSTAHAHTRVPGSATACVLQLDRANACLTAANLGDSGFFVVRDQRVALKSKPLQHFFDCPLQFGAYPEYVEATDTADQAEVFQLPLQVGDVIIAGSDGLWDNCYDDEILSQLPRGPEEVEQAANRLALLARQHAADPEFPSPYTKEAVSQGYDLPWWEKLLGVRFKDGRLQLKQLTGGKMDDITVVVACVEQEEVPAAAEAGAAAAAGSQQEQQQACAAAGAMADAAAEAAGALASLPSPANS